MGHEGETSECFVAGPRLYFVKWGGSAVCQDNITTAHLYLVWVQPWHSVAGGAQARARHSYPELSAEGSHHSPSVISVIPEQILQFPEIGRAAWHCLTRRPGRGSSGPDSGGKLPTALCWPQFRVPQEADYYNNNHLVLPSLRELAWRLRLGYGYG